MMMKKTGRVVSCCVALLLALTSVSAVERKLDSINDLKEINFGHSVPKHSMLLLYWFANAVDIDWNNDMRLTFDPESRAYGSHRYANYEGLLDYLPWGNGYHYYTLGSLNQLHPYVVCPQISGYASNNMDRIIVRIRDKKTGQQVPQTIDQVYITQHLNNQREYDPDHTYRITTNLLREIREFSGGQNNQQLVRLRNRFGSTADVSNADVSTIINTWGGFAGLGLLLFIVIQDRHFFTQQNSRLQSHYTPQHNYGHTNNWVSDDMIFSLLFGFVLICVFIFFIFLGSLSPSQKVQW